MLLGGKSLDSQAMICPVLKIVIPQDGAHMATLPVAKDFILMSSNNIVA